MAETTGTLRAQGGASFAVECLIEGPAAAGRGLALTAPISFWGGVDPKTGVIADVRHPQHGIAIAGTVLMLPGTIGSSSASAVLLELIHRNIAPAAIVMHEPDAILLLGVLVAREMGWPHPAAWRLDARHYGALDGEMVEAAPRD
jgi:predicted aconitase with swiveling domain